MNSSNLADQTHPSSPEQVLIENVRALLKLRKMNEAELARQANVPKPTLHKILAGSTEDPRISTLQAIAHVFDMTVDELYSPNVTRNTQHKIEVQPIPVISWSDCLKGKAFVEELTAASWKKWLVISNTKKGLYGLSSKASMESQFPIGTVFVIDPQGVPGDGDLVVVKYPNSEEAALRELSVDGPIKLLLPMNDYAEREKLTSDVQILGTVVHSRLDIDY